MAKFDILNFPGVTITETLTWTHHASTATKDKINLIDPRGKFLTILQTPDNTFTSSYTRGRSELHWLCSDQFLQVNLESIVTGCITSI